MEERNYKFEKSHLVDEINSLLKISFGKGFFGDYRLVAGTELNGWLHRFNDKLDIIAKTRWYSFMPFLHGAEIQVGRFINQDGSRMQILDKFRKQAIKYSEIYSTKFNKPVEISDDYHRV